MIQTPGIDALEEEERRKREGANGERPILEPREWPDPLDERAYWGIAGRFTRTVALHTEADPTAVLVQFLAAAGNAMGRGPACGRA